MRESFKSANYISTTSSIAMTSEHSDTCKSKPRPGMQFLFLKCHCLRAYRLPHVWTDVLRVVGVHDDKTLCTLYENEPHAWNTSMHSAGAKYVLTAYKGTELRGNC